MQSKNNGLFGGRASCGGRSGVRPYWMAALAPFILLIVLFELLPVATVVVRSFLPEGTLGFTLKNYADIFTKRLYRTAIVNSLGISVLSAAAGLAVAFYGARAACALGGKRKNGFMSLLNMVSNFAGVPLAFSYIIMLGNTGVLTMIGKYYGITALSDFPLYTAAGLMIVYIYFQIPLATLLLIPAFEAIRTEWKEAVSLLGGTERVFWRKVGIPVLLPALLGTFSTLFANALAAYATAYALTSGNVSLLPIRISEQFKGDVVQHPEFGSALSVLLILLMTASILGTQRIVKRMKGGV